MALEAILVEVAKSLVSHMSSQAYKEVAFAWGLEKHVKKLENTMGVIVAGLKDMEFNPQSRSIQSVDQDWFSKLREAVYEADDLFDEIKTKAESKRLMERNTFKKEVRLFLSSSNQLVSCFKLAQKVKAVREKLEDIAKDRRDFGNTMGSTVVVQNLNEGRNNYDVVAPGLSRETCSFVEDDRVVGRKDDKDRIIRMLLDTSIDQETIVSVIPIIGVGGLGKTTLAQLVYKDELVKENFDLQLWVSVPRVIDLKEVIGKIIASATNSEPPSSNYGLDQLETLLSRHITGKKYLLVLDDVWDDDPRKWKQLEPMLRRGASPGSKILVTARILKVGEIMGSIKPYELPPLKYDDSWSLFEKVAFKEKGRHEPGVREIGRDILKMCINVPLVIHAVAGILATIYTVKGWSLFKDNELSNLASYGDEFDPMPILKLSYDHLKPIQLKSCFSYCSLFPRGYVFGRSMLAHLWIAQGFIDTPRKKGQSLEELGEEYVDVLLNKNLFQSVERSDESDSSCRLHDLMYDLSCSVAGKQCKILKSSYGEDNDFDRSVRHVSIGYQIDSSWEVPATLQSAQQVRTFLLAERPAYEANMTSSVIGNLVSCLQCLRALDLHGLGIRELPKSIGNLIHLRYLDLSGNQGLHELPDSITLLHNLRYLNLIYCDKLIGLPKDMKNLVNLRHIYFNWWVSWGQLLYFPSGLGNLTNLEKLDVFVVPKRSEKHSPRCGGATKSRSYARLSDLGSLNNLSGGLTIFIRGWYENMAHDARIANLRSKKNLDNLRLFWTTDECRENEMVFENLQPQDELSCLSINGYRGTKLPTWMVRNQIASSLAHLVGITFHSCPHIKHLPSFSQLPHLDSILLYDLPGVEYLHSSSSSSSIDDEYEACPTPESISSPASTIFFPSLTKIEIGHLHNLKGWSRSRVEGLSFPRLSRVKIYHCYELESMPLCPNVEDLSLIHVAENLEMLKAEETGTICSSSSGSAPKLEMLTVSTVEYLVSLPRERLKGVSRLSLCWSCWPMDFAMLGAGLEGMTCLRTLEFYECIGLTSLKGMPPQFSILQRLELYKCELIRFSDNDDDDDDCNAWKVLTNLRSLSFTNIPMLEALPRGLQQVMTLESLELKNCSNLAALPSWIGNLCSLSKLEIVKCSDLASLPHEMKDLKNLKLLVVDNCSILAPRCQRQVGEDWPKIQHVKDVIVMR